MKARLTLLTFVAVASTLFALPVSAGTLLYDNGPVGNGYTGAFDIWGGYSVTDSFTLAAASTLTTAQVGLWTYISEAPPDSLNWSITTSPLGGATVASGVAALTNAFVGVGYYTEYYVYQSTFSLGGASLAAGTYYLQLDQGTSSGGDFLLWDVNNGPSQAWNNSVGSVFGQCAVGATSCSESFQIYGSPGSTVPEPGTLALT